MSSTNLSDAVIQQISNLLEEKGYVAGKNLSLSQLEKVPEYIILSSIFQSPEKSVRNEELESKIPESLAMTLSNLGIDQIIYQSSSDYRWRLTEEILQKLTAEIAAEEIEESAEEPTTVDDGKSTFMATLKKLGLDFSTRADEFTVLSYLFNNEESSMDELTAHAGISMAISLILSNLQADGLVEQTPSYKWRISASLADKLQQANLATQEQESDVEESQSPHLGLDDATNQYLILALQQRGLLQGVSPSDNLLKIPEFEIVYYVYTNDALSVADLNKFVTHKDSLALNLSNLHADQIIEQKASTWMISPTFQRIINSIKSQQRHHEKTKIETQKKEKEQKYMHAKQRQLEALAAALTELGAPYVQQISNPKDLLNFSEMELLLALMQFPELTTEELEKKVFSPNSISLSLSNLQADRLVVQRNYKWQISPQLVAVLAAYNPSSPAVVDNSAEVLSSESLDQKEVYSKQLKLRKYFFNQSLIDQPDVPIEELLKRADYELLWIIMHNEQIDTDEIQKLVKTEFSLSMELSNLAADNLIEYLERESKWKISAQFQTNLRKIELDNAEILAEVHTQNPETKESISLVNFHAYDLEIISILQNNGYTISEQMGLDAASTPEFQVIKIVHANSPIDALSLEKLVPDSVPLSLTLSNLLADNIIKESEYKYFIAQEYAGRLSTLLDSTPVQQSAPQNPSELKIEPSISQLSPPSSSIPEQVVDEQKDENEKKEKARAEINRKLQELQEQSKIEDEYLVSLGPFISAVYDLGYIQGTDRSLQEYKKNPEFSVLLAVYESPGVDSATIKHQINAVSPVVISRTINKLEADGYLQINTEGKLNLTNGFLEYLK